MSIRVKELKEILSKMDDNADIEVSLNGVELGHLVESVKISDAGELILDITHYCDE